MALESIRAAQWLYTVLSGDATLAALVGADPRGVVKVYSTRANTAAALPYIVFQQTGGEGDTQTADGRRVMDRELWQVVVYSEGNDSGVYAPICDRIDTLLHRQSGIAADGTVLYCLRQRTFPNPLEEENRTVMAQVMEFTLGVTV